MRCSISDTKIGSLLDFDHGEGWVLFSWVDGDGIDRTLTIDFHGFCSREMPLRSGRGVSITSVLSNKVVLRLPEDLANDLELGPEVEFKGDFSESVAADLLRLSEKI